MTPATFARTYGTLADEAAKLAPHLSRWTILAQWAVETGWGTSPLCRDGNNLAGIRWYGREGTVQIGGTRGVDGTGFAGYRSLGAFVEDYARTMRLSYYAHVLAIPAADVETQLRALGASPWDAGHYLRHGVVGGSIIEAWHLLPDADAPAAPSLWHLRIAPGAEVVTYALGGTRSRSTGTLCIARTIGRSSYTGAEHATIPCHPPAVRALCGHDAPHAHTATPTAGGYTGDVIRVSPEHGVTVVRNLGG